MDIINFLKENKMPPGYYHYFNNFPNGKLLDLGCGMGREALFLSEAGFQVTCVDKKLECISNIKSKNSHITTHHCHIEDFPFEDQYHGITAKTVLHFLSRSEIGNLIKKMQSATLVDGINFLVVFTDDIPIKGKATLLKKGEILSYYTDWEIIRDIHKVIPLHKDSPDDKPHQHAIEIAILRKPKSS